METSSPSYNGVLCEGEEIPESDALSLWLRSCKPDEEALLEDQQPAVGL